MIVIVDDILIISESRAIISVGWDPYIGSAHNKLHECNGEYEDTDVKSRPSQLPSQYMLSFWLSLTNTESEIAT